MRPAAMRVLALSASVYAGLFALQQAAVAKQGPSVAQAIRQSQQTGRPIFAVAGASYCPACKKLLNTLNTEASLRPFISQFVPLKINAQSDDYARWKKFFPPKRSAIPALYIVSSQGEQLYGSVGALPQQSLKKVMLASLEKAGRFPGKDDWTKIGEDLEKANKALQEEKYAEATQLLEPTLSGLSNIGNLAELSEPGRKATEQVEAMGKQQRAALEKALAAFQANSSFESALRVTQAEQLCELFPGMKAEANLLVKKSAKEAEQRKLLRQASELLEAEALLADKKSQRKAVRSLERITKRYPQTEAASRAKQLLGGAKRD